MRFISGFFIGLLTVLFTSGCSSAFVIRGSNCISPFDFGLDKAKTGAERYEVLLKTHQAALSRGVDVDYSGIKRIEIEVPEKALPIPLTQFNDFKGCVIEVKNNRKSCKLFTKVENGLAIEIPKTSIDAGDFRSINLLNKGRYLLIIEDQRPWVINRKGHSYGHQRKDILLIENGISKNKVIMPYNNANSSPKCSYIRIGEKPLVIKNLTIERNPGCTYVTHSFYISGYDNVIISNITTRTPQSELYGDGGIQLLNCTNVSLENVSIEGTYSQKDHYGYGVSMNNIWNFYASRMSGKANWGIFGNNNINTVRIEDSQINRFDIHCYGRDISFKNVDFFDWNNQYASVYGTITHDNCTFSSFVPVLNGGSYNSFVAHDLVFNDCVFTVTPQKNYIIRMTALDEGKNERPELAEKCLPNVRINNLTVNMIDGATEFFLFYNRTTNGKVTSIGYLNSIVINGLKVFSDGVRPVKRFSLSNIEIQTKKPVDCQINEVIVNQQPKGSRSKASLSGTIELKSNISLKGGGDRIKNVQNLRYSP